MVEEYFDVAMSDCPWFMLHLPEIVRQHYPHLSITDTDVAQVFEHVPSFDSREKCALAMPHFSTTFRFVVL